MATNPTSRVIIPNPAATSTQAEPKPSRYASYQADVTADIMACVEGMSCQPILFIGSGVSRRYFDAPSWDELLTHLATECPLIDKEYAFYKQSLRSPLLIGREFAKKFQEWAWSSGRSQFPTELFDQSVPESAYLKHRITQYLVGLTPTSLKDVKASLMKKELTALQAIRPHAIITTNYDQFLELVFPEYMPVVGQQIIRGHALSVGEIFKIHGCVSAPSSLVVTQDDCDDFAKRKKYLSAKLLTFFTEHPLVFVGNGAGDPNIKAILSDIDEALPETGGIIDNVYIIEWRPGTPSENPTRERLIEIEGAKGVRVKAIDTPDFVWPFEAFGTTNFNPRVSAKLLRALMVRSYELVRTDIPRKTVHANFEMLEHAVETSAEFAKLFGISTIADPSVISARYPHILRRSQTISA